MVYRAEIDGLRAIAVVSVILFHAGLDVVGGGYVGVDVFFVISGYLITSIILADKQAGKFSLAQFYERRARRILPALFFIMAATVPFVVLWMPPDELKEFFQSVAAVSTFSSNILFWQTSGYFDTVAELRPLLHTWSLAIEEQYYFLFPLFLIVVWSLGSRWIVAILVIIALVSLAAAQWGSIYRPSGTFYLLPTRAWEFCIGAFAAIHHMHKPEVKGNQALSLLGLMMIGYSVFAFDRHTPFPSLYAIVPTLGTVLVILFASAETIACRLLSAKAVVLIGLVSYSAYLWHQPMFALARYKALTEPSMPLMFALSLASIVLAYFSWRFVEKPLRNRSHFTRKQIFAASALATVCFISVGVAGGITDLKAYPPELNDVYVADYRDYDVCHIKMEVRSSQVKTCLDTLPRSKVVLFGDSHASAISRALREKLKAQGIGLITFSHGTCIPIRNLSMEPIERNTSCVNFKNDVLDFLGGLGNVPVVLGGRWTQNIAQSPYDNLEGGVEKSSDGKVVATDSSGKRILATAVEDRIGSAIRELSARHPIVIVNQIPEAGWNVPHFIYKQLRDGLFTGKVTTSSAAYRERNSTLNRLLGSLTSDEIKVVQTEKIVCDAQIPGRCVNYLNGRSYYFDDDHPSYFYSQLIAQRVTSAILTLGGPAIPLPQAVQDRR